MKRHDSLWPGRMAVSLLAEMALAASAFAAISVTDTSVRQGPDSSTILSYRLNEAATSVQINLSNGTTLTGGTARGLNEVAYTGPRAGVTATITATAPAESGAGGGVLVAPLAALKATNITGVDAFRRAASPYKGQFTVAAGFSAGTKEVYRIAGDGTVLKSNDLVAIAGANSAASWPFGVAVAQEDPQDRIFIPNRSRTRMVVLNPKGLTRANDLDGAFNYTGISVTPVYDSFGAVQADQFNVYMGGNVGGDEGKVWHFAYNLAANTRSEPGTNPTADTTSTAYKTGVAVDARNQVMFQTQNAALGAAGTASKTLTKWTSTDYGISWTLDTVWSTAVTTSIGVADAVPRGVALDAGFDAANLSASHIWVSITGGAGSVNRLVRVNAATGLVTSTIDLTQVAIPQGGITLADKPAHFLAVDPYGNIGLTVGSVALNGVAASHFGIVAPNTVAATSATTAAFSVEPPLSATGSANPPRVGNTGNATAVFTVDVFAPLGIQADNVQVTTDLTAIGGTAGVTLTRGAISADGKSATYTTSQKVPANATLGPVTLNFTVTGTSETTQVPVTLSVYQAYVPTWEVNVTGGVSASPAANGATAYVGTDAGNVYALNGADGAAVTSFGSGGVVNVGEPVKGGIVAANGRLYVPGTSHLFILDIGTGVQTGAAALPNPTSVALYPTDPTTVFVGAADNKVHALNADTGAQKYASADLGAAVNEPSIGPSELDYVLVAGTEAISGTGGKIVMLKPTDLTEAYPALIDTGGAVRSKAAFSLMASGNYFAIGGASGLWGVNADTGQKLGGTDQWSTTVSTQNGNPFGTSRPVDADPAIASVSGNPRIMFATTSGELFSILSIDGSKVSFGGFPAPITTPPGTGGFADGAGLLVRRGPATSDGTTDTRIVYMGSDQNDRRFFAVNTLPDDSTYTASADKVRIFDPNDTATFPNETPGAFSVKPVLADGSIVTGSSAGRVYGFAPIVTPPPYVVTVTPANGAYNVPTNQAVTVNYSAALTAFQGTITVYQNGVAVPGSVGYGSDDKSLTFTPTGALTANRSYTVVVSDVQDAAGNLLPAFTSTFFTGAKPVVAHDVNGDQAFNLEDIREVLRMASGLKAATAPAVTQGDVAAPTGRLTLEDAVALRKMLP